MNLPYECAEGICRNTNGESWLPFIIATALGLVGFAYWLHILGDD
ncbi:MAG: hypothetical protein JW384_01604 [Nitrosomonadaceae bacterium]|nr:hypothetical protein [Nitrosomonadaceae bacterium]